MRQTVRLGRIAGIPIGAHWSVLFILALLTQGLAISVLPASAPRESIAAYWGVAVVVAALFLLTLLVHELAHALVARHYGVRSRRITLWLLGGVTELEGEAPHPRGDLLIALVGPLTSLAIAAVTGGAAFAVATVGPSRLVVAALGWLAIVNALLGVFNLLPGAPLDGGRVLRAAVWWIRGDRGVAQRVASRAGVVLGMLLVVGGVAQVFLTRALGGFWLVLLGWFLISAARAERLDLRDALAGIRVGDVMSSPAVYGSANQTVDDFITSVARRYPHPAYPVLDPDGRLAGMVTLADLAKVDGAQRPATRLAAVQEPLAQMTVLDAATPLADRAAELLTPGHRLAAVLADDRLVGVVTGGDVNRSIEMAGLRAAVDRNAPDQR